MSTIEGPNLISSGLIFNYDMNNTSTSWVGRPVTNMYYAVNSWLCGASNDWTNSGAATWNFNDTSIAPPNVPNSGSLTAALRISSAEVTTAGNQQVGMNIVNVSPSTQYTMSVWFYQNASTCCTGNGTAPYFRTVVNNNYLAGFTYNGSTDSSTWPVGQWIRISATATVQSNETGIYLSSYIGNTPGQKIYYYGYQVEQNSYASPLAAGTRSTTQSLLDLTRRSTATSNSLVYNSDNTFQFLYSNPSTVQVPLSTSFNKLEGTVNVWIYPTSYNGGNGIFVNNDSTGYNYVDWLWIGPYSGTFYFRLGDGSTCCNNDLTIANYNSVVPVNTWTNLCCTWKSGGTSAIYINGSLNTSRSISSIPATNPTSTGLFGCGHANADSYFNGKMPNAAIYNRQLTADEVLQNFNALRKVYGI